MINTHHQILSGLSNQGIWNKLGKWHVWGTWGLHVGFWWGKPKEGNHLEDLRV